MIEVLLTIFLSFTFVLSDKNVVNQFSLNLQDLICGNQGNCVISGYSIFNAVGLAYAGAEGETRKQIQNMIGLNDLDFEFEEVNEIYKSILESVSKNFIDLELYSANRFYGDEKTSFSSEYLSILKDYYDSDSKTLDFSGDSEGSRKKINQWVKKQTKDLIQDFLQPGSINPMTIAVLVNAIYFKGVWARNFDVKDTFQDIFTTQSGEQKSVDFMRQFEKEYKIGNILNSKASFVKLPYKNNEASMYIIIPKPISRGVQQIPPPQKSDLKSVIQELKNSNLTEIFSSGLDQEIDLYLPKFSIEFETSLSDYLKNLGMLDAFDPFAANFGGMVENFQDIQNQNQIQNQNLYISEGFHKTKIVVDEFGTEAAAATGLVIVKLSATIAPQIKIDEPFGFYIVHEPSQVILFSGVIDDPTL